MRLYEEIFQNTEYAAKCCILVGGGGYFEGVKTVGDFSPQKIVLHFPKYGVEIEGENLSIKKYGDGDLELSGKIYTTKLLGVEERTQKEQR